MASLRTKNIRKKESPAGSWIPFVRPVIISLPHVLSRFAMGFRAGDDAASAAALIVTDKIELQMDDDSIRTFTVGGEKDFFTLSITED